MRVSGETGRRLRLSAPYWKDTNPLTGAAQDNGQNPEKKNLRWTSEKWIIIVLQKRKLRLRETSEPGAKAVEFKDKSLSSTPQA